MKKTTFTPVGTSMPKRRESMRERYRKSIAVKLFMLCLFIFVAYLVGSNIHMSRALQKEQANNEAIRVEVVRLTAQVTSLEAEIKHRDAEISALYEESRNLYTQLTEEVQRVSELTEMNARLTRNPYNFSDLTEPSNATPDKIDKFLAKSNLHGYGSAYIEAEEKYGVNAYMLASLHVWESGWGTSQIFIEKNNGFGWRAYNESLESAKHFDTVEESIDYVAYKIKTLYLEDNGKFHNGRGLEEINVKYAQNKDGSPNYAWSRGIRQLMRQMASN
jgi:beta-N-acetylglucosaminidase